MAHSIARLMEKTGAREEDIKLVRDIMEMFLERMKKRSPEDTLLVLKRKIDEVYLDISESDWLEWIRKDVKRWQYVDRAINKFKIRSRKELMNYSYMLFVRSVYLGVIKLMSRKIKNN